MKKNTQETVAMTWLVAERSEESAKKSNLAVHSWGNPTKTKQKSR